jgi:hypothetical protein
MSEVLDPPVAAPAAAPAATPAAEPAPQPAVAWLPKADADTSGYIQTKGWAGPEDVLTSYRNLEKMVGADRAGRTVVLPAGEDANEWGQVFDKLGRPSNADGYKLPVPEGADPGFAKLASSKFHELGITAKQGAALAAWWNEQAGTQTSAMAAAEEAALAAEHAALAKDWGTGPDAQFRRELARRAAVHLGLDEASIAAMEKVAGYSKTMKALAKMGDLLKEHGAEGLGEMGSFGMTPEGARSRKGQLMADKAWRDRAMNPASAEWAEIQKLDRIIFAGSQG